MTLDIAPRATYTGTKTDILRSTRRLPYCSCSSAPNAYSKSSALTRIADIYFAAYGRDLWYATLSQIHTMPHTQSQKSCKLCTWGRFLRDRFSGRNGLCASLSTCRSRSHDHRTQANDMITYFALVSIIKTAAAVEPTNVHPPGWMPDYKPPFAILFQGSGDDPLQKKKHRFCKVRRFSLPTQFHSLWSENPDSIVSVAIITCQV